MIDAHAEHAVLHSEP